MRNDEQQPAQGPQAQAQQPYTGWQYDQDEPSPRAPVAPPSYPSSHPNGSAHQAQYQPPQHNNTAHSPGYPAPQPNNAAHQPGYHPSLGPQKPSYPPPGYLPDHQPGYPSAGYPIVQNEHEDQHEQTYDPDLTMDMGNSLSYGQSIQFHAISLPQPTQSMQKLRLMQLQQRREERMRRQQRRMGPNTTFFTRRSGQPAGPENRLVLPPVPEANSPENRGQGTLEPPARPSFPYEYSPDLDAAGQAAVGPRDPGRHIDAAALMATELLPAAEPAQDTGMIQRIKVARFSSLISGALLLSSILGLLQTFLFTYVFGASLEGDAYLQAYIIPNLIFTVVAGGALSSAFIPVFSAYAVGHRDDETAWHVASSALNFSVVIMIAFSIIGFLLAPVLVPIYTKNPRPGEIALIVTLTRIMLIQAIVLGSGVIVGAILNTKQDFTRTALGTVLYNVGLNLGLLPGFFLTFHARTGSPSDVAVYAATWGVILGAILQLSVQIPGLFKVNMHYTFAFDWKHPGVRQIGKQMVPRVINAVMLSFSTIVDRTLLTVIAVGVTGIINEYFQAFSILLLPVSIFGSAVSTAAFPTLAGYVTRGRFDRVRSIIMETLRGILFLTIPSAIGLIVLAFPIAQTLLEHGNFTLQDAQLTSVPLLFFAFGLPALAAVEILTRSFYALQDSKTPVSISVAQFILKIALAIVLVNLAVFGVQWGMGALALSTSIASILEALVLFFLLSQRIKGFNLYALRDFFARVLLASAVLFVVLILLRLGLDHLIDTTSTQKQFIPGILKALLKLLIELGGGSLAFLATARLLHMEEMNSGLVRRVLNILHIPWL